MVADWPTGEVDEDSGTDERAKSGGLTDLFRKAAMSSIGAFFMTEEGIRSFVKDLKLPKDAVDFFTDQAERRKDEFLRILGDELRRFLRSPTFRKEVLGLLSEMTIEVDAKIRLKPGSVQLKVDSVEVKGRGDAKSSA